ncbi:MAG: phosphoglucomutase/phosphomannomutase family protein, partial [Dehalococcoidales bacterium]|nr:phosphoglucomutase/phosphomannomutase family protein [Dehalococcoidales bacterium]
ESIDNIRVDRLDTRDGFRFMLADTSWLLIRFSNTEPLLRLYAESNSQEKLERLLELAQELVQA